MFHNDLIHYSDFSFLALSVDHEISKYFSDDEDFKEFKKCSKTGTTNSDCN